MTKTIEGIDAAYALDVNYMDEEDLGVLDRNFTYHPPSPTQPERYEAIRKMAKELARSVLTWAPPSRERSIAITNIEQSVMWANAAIARNETLGIVEVRIDQDDEPEGDLE